MPRVQDGPASALFFPVLFRGNASLLKLNGVSDTMRRASAHAPEGRCVCWGIPFDIRRVILASGAPRTITFTPTRARWLVFMHTTDLAPETPRSDGFVRATRGPGRLNEHVADYVFMYHDGVEERATIRRRHQIGMVQRPWGENCFQAVAHIKPYPVPPASQQPVMGPWGWGFTQTRVAHRDNLPWVNWLWAWENPRPTKAIIGLRIEPLIPGIVISGLAAGNIVEHPLRWQRRRKAVLALPRGEAVDPTLDEMGRLKHVQIDLGQIISAELRKIYPDDVWNETCNNEVPQLDQRRLLVEYTSHPEGRFHLPGAKPIPVATVESGKSRRLAHVAPATQRVRIRVVDKRTKRPVAVKLHVHGAAGEYLSPVDRHRIPNDGWIEDHSCDYVNEGRHYCTYIEGETVIDLPLGRVYVEVSKGFEVRPIRKIVNISAATRQVTVTVEKVLSWRERGWVTADTHVHFVSPTTALLEGEAEGVNVVNLLASQWGELMTNVSDFDGKTTLGAAESGGSGEWLVRVGTENRQHVLGHISLLGYDGSMISPLCVGGPDESALGDPVDAMLSDWARQCRKQGGLVVMPHFPQPRCENALNLMEGEVDAVEMTSWSDLYHGIDPYALSDWYRYLNCGCACPAVGGTDKMTAATPIGAIRTYARIPDGGPFTYSRWMDAVRSGDTFVTYGPLLEFSVEGRPPGSRIAMNRTGGTVSIEWRAESVTVPMTRVDLVVNGAIRESLEVEPESGRGDWTVSVDRSSWIAILIRGRYPYRKEMIAAHSSAVLIDVEGSPFFSAADAVTILEQIEGAIAYLDTIGTRAEERRYREMRLRLTSGYRRLHNRLHRLGQGHVHQPPHDHHD